MNRAPRRVLQPFVLLALLLAAPAQAFDTHRVDSHAPIGVMADHVHGKGEWMLSYRYARMAMDGNRDGTRRLSTADVLRDYPVAPTSMDMEMHMFGVMYAPSDRITLAGMLPYVRLSMDHRTRTGRSFTTRSDGIGDLTLQGLFKLFETERLSFHASFGLGIPTGSTTKRDDTPAGRVRLPYPMQLGSGTVDAIPALTLLGQQGRFSWGSQLRGIVRLHRNRHDYRRGHEVALTGWVAWKWTRWLSTAVRLEYLRAGNFSGADDSLNPRVVPTASPILRSGQRLDALLSANFQIPDGPLHGHRLAIEVGRPIVQDLRGPQLEVDWRLTVGWQKAF